LVLHVLNGDSVRFGLEHSGISGDVVVWPDVLYEGPTPLATGEEWIAARTAYLTAITDRAVDDVSARYRRDDAALESFREHDEVVFWFEHDLFDQLLLIRHLWWMGERGARSVGGGTRFSLVCRDTYLGLLQPEAFPALFADRRAITEAQINLGSHAWTAFCGDDPSRLLPFATAVSPDLPFLSAALRRFLEDYPSTLNGLSRTEAQILRVASDGPLSVGKAFRESAALEQAVFMGDLSFFGIVKGLACARQPLLTIDEPSNDPTSFVEKPIRRTEAGRTVLAGRADHIALNGIDRWMGGVHLAPGHLWRWTGTSVIRAAS
jgi:hypothetical protein